MYRVLLPIDENESRARAQVEAILELPVAVGDLAVDVVHVYGSTTDAEWAAGGSFTETFEEEMAEQVRNTDRIPPSVETAVDLLESSDHEFTVHERSGKPAEEILAFAEDRDSDAIVVGSHRRSPVGKVLFGSVAQAVILDSDLPVTVVSEQSAES